MALRTCNILDTTVQALLRQLEDALRQLSWANSCVSEANMVSLQLREDARQRAARVEALEHSLQQARADAAQAVAALQVWT